jgi:hypothetical protein
MSIAVNPLMHWAAEPSPTFRIYWITKDKKVQISDTMTRQYLGKKCMVARLRGLMCGFTK